MSEKKSQLLWMRNEPCSRLRVPFLQWKADRIFREHWLEFNIIDLRVVWWFEQDVRGRILKLVSLLRMLFTPYMITLALALTQFGFAHLRVPHPLGFDFQHPGIFSMRTSLSWKLLNLVY